jgi:hypothetical protein
MATENLGWGAPRIHGELLKLGIDISERTVSRLMPRRHNLRRPGGRFLPTTPAGSPASDFLTVPTATFRIHYYVFLVLSLERRRAAWITSSSSANLTSA